MKKGINYFIFIILTLLIIPNVYATTTKCEYKLETASYEASATINIFNENTTEAWINTFNNDDVNNKIHIENWKDFKSTYSSLKSCPTYALIKYSGTGIKIWVSNDKATLSDIIKENKYKTKEAHITTWTDSAQYRDINDEDSDTSSKTTNSGETVEDTCEGLLGDSEFYAYLQDVFDLIQLGGSICALVFGMTDMLKAVASGEDDAKKKSFKNFGRRLTAAVLLYLIPAILTLILNLVDNLNGSTCGLN